MNMTQWLKQRLDRFELRVRGGRTKKGRENNDCYYSAGWADGYKAAQRDARAASRETNGPDFSDGPEFAGWAERSGSSGSST
jgi:hypothetical protein